MTHKTIVDIVEKCLKIDAYVSEAYNNLSRASKEPVLAKFWEAMSSKEAENLRFWNSVHKFVVTHDLSYIFDDPDSTLSRLETSVIKLNGLNPNYESHNIEQQFELAFRLEFHILNELAFESLLHIFSPISQVDAPEELYGERIMKICEQYAKSGDKHSVTNLLTAGFQMLWERNRDLAKWAYSDPLTKLKNKRGFYALAVQLAYLGKRNEEEAGVLMIDVDNLKNLNDEKGHHYGDQVLIGVANTLNDSVRTSDIVGRYGGDEFIVYLPNLKGELETTVERITKNIRKSDVTVSIGGVAGLIKGEELSWLDNLMKAADHQLYKAKRIGKNGYCTSYVND